MTDEEEVLRLAYLFACNEVAQDRLERAREAQRQATYRLQQALAALHEADRLAIEANTAYTTAARARAAHPAQDRTNR